MRLIDADALVEIFHKLSKKKWNQGTLWAVAFELAAEYTDDASTIDPIKHGEWQWWHDDNAEPHEAKDFLICSQCKRASLYDRGMQEESSKYCPSCGAEMDPPKETHLEFMRRTYGNAYY